MVVIEVLIALDDETGAPSTDVRRDVALGDVVLAAEFRHFVAIPMGDLVEITVDVVERDGCVRCDVRASRHLASYELMYRIMITDLCVFTRLCGGLLPGCW